MKNIHILPTDKPSRLFYNVGGALLFTNYENQNGVNIYITNNEELVLGGYHFNSRYGDEPQKTNQRDIDSRKYWEEEDYYITKIILTTDTQLIQDGVQAIDDGFLEWFVKNPSCEEVEIESWKIDKEWDKVHRQFNPICPQKTKYKIIISKEELLKDEIDKFFVDMVCNPKEEPKQETLEEVAENYSIYNEQINKAVQEAVKFGAKWQQERMYNEEEVKKLAFDFYYDMSLKMKTPEQYISENRTNVEEWFEQFKKK